MLDRNKISSIMLSLEEQSLQDTIDKLTDELYSQLRIPRRMVEQEDFENEEEN